MLYQQNNISHRNYGTHQSYESYKIFYGNKMWKLRGSYMTFKRESHVD